jgi:aconitate hydratase
MLVTSVLSGNRNFEGRISPDVKANYLASPPLCVVYALTGTMNIDLNNEAIGTDKNGKPVFMKDLWPSNAEVTAVVNKHISAEMYKKRYANVFEGDERWKKVEAPKGQMYAWEPKSTYIRCPNYFDDIGTGVKEQWAVDKARVLALFGDSVTTDHISPAGNIAKDSPAAKYLSENGVDKKDFNSYGSRRGNHETMMRGTFANIRIKNEMLGGEEGGNTLLHPTKTKMSIYDAAMAYKKEGAALVVFGGKEYGSGSSRDWAAKGPFLQGVKAVVVESFERIHRSNLVGMGIMPLQFTGGADRKSFALVGDERISLKPVGAFKPRMEVEMTIERADGSVTTAKLLSRVDTVDELNYLKNGGILQYVLRNLKNS